MGMTVSVKLRKKTAKMYSFYDAWLLLYRTITLISSLDQRFSVGIRRGLETGLYLTTLFSILFYL